MSEKVMITQEQFNWLQRYKSDEEIDYAIDIQIHRKRPDSPIVDWKPSELARAFYNGYEIKPEYKVGDCILDIFGYIRLIKRIADDGTYLGDEFRLMKKQIDRHATLEEIEADKKCQLWKKLDREVGEFKEQDIGFTWDGLIIRGNHLKVVYERGNLQGFYRQEDFKTFEIEKGKH